MVIEFQTSTTVMNCWNHSKKHGMNGTPKDQPPNPSQFRLQSYQCILICLGLAPEIIGKRRSGTAQKEAEFGLHSK